MNSLSWFLYLADMLPALGLTCGLLAGFGAVVYPITIMWLNDFGRERGDYTVNFKVMASVIALLMVVAVIIPSKSTIYLIAGSEAGEAVVTSVEGQEILNDIKTIIKQQIKGD
ncbi:MAG: hypothetical protein JKY50_00010 [Oleispira sp.]|nr:hypothetical protein [Oleispira sp.]